MVTSLTHSLLRHKRLFTYRFLKFAKSKFREKQFSVMFIFPQHHCE